MKNWVYIFFLLCSTNLFGQHLEEELRLLMLEHPSYVSFKDSDKLDPGVRQTKDLVAKFLTSKGENIDDYYLGNDLILQTTYQGGELNRDKYLSFPIHHINTFKALLKFKKTYPEKYRELMKGLNPVRDMVGNASGKDGWIEINWDMDEVKFTVFE